MSSDNSGQVTNSLGIVLPGATAAIVQDRDGHERGRVLDRINAHSRQMQAMNQEEVIVKLAFPFLEWKEVIKSGERVCKRWKAASDSNDVWRPLCERDIAFSELRLGNSRKYFGTMLDNEYYSAQHEILATQMNKMESTGKSCREIFILSQRMGSIITDHESYGPDALIRGMDTDGDRKLRDICLQYYPRLVLPTIETLRNVFGESDGKKERFHRTFEMRSKLLCYAQSHSILRRKMFSYLEDKQIFTAAGWYMLGAATISLTSFEEDAFIASSPIQTSVGEIVKGVEGLIGSKISLPMSVQLKRSSCGKFGKEFIIQPPTKRLRSMNGLNDLEWPLNPIDVSCFLSKEIWAWEHNVDTGSLDFNDPNTVKAEAEMWKSEKKKWWAGLARPIRQLLLTIYSEKLAERFTDVDPLPEDVMNESRDIPMVALNSITELTYQHFRGEAAKIFWNDLNPELRSAIFNLYKQQCSQFCDTIQQEYSSIYGGNDPESSAKILLEIFLDVPPDHEYTKSSEMTSDYCQALTGRMEEALNHWDRLIAAVKGDDETLWDPNMISEIESASSKFGIDIISQKPYSHFNKENEFCVGFMLKRFLYQLLSSQDDVPQFYDMRCKVEEMLKLIDRNAANLADTQEATRQFRSYSAFNHVREHSMIALILLLPNLSERDSKRLIYAVFIQKSHSMRRGVDFSRGENFDNLSAKEIPPPRATYLNLHYDIMDAREWINSPISYYLEHGVESRLFGLPLPKNIVSAMCQFMLENLYQTNSLFDVDFNKKKNAFGVMPYMERFVHENSDDADLVWDALDNALQNAIAAVQQFDANNIEERERRVFESIVGSLIGSCIRTRAKKVIPTIRTFYRTIPAELMPDNFVNFETLTERISEAPKIAVDTRAFHDLYQSNEQL